MTRAIQKCLKCKGSGREYTKAWTWKRFVNGDYVPCSECKGKGFVNREIEKKRLKA